MSTASTVSLDSIHRIVSARYGGPKHRAAPAELTPTEAAALRTWMNRLMRAQSGGRQIVLPNGAVVWA
jgi:hypothetical protein